MSRLVELALRHVDPRTDLRIIDPACGTGDLLVEVCDTLVDRHGWSSDAIAEGIRGADDADYGAAEALEAWRGSSSTEAAMVGVGDLLAHGGEPVQGRLFESTPRWTPPEQFREGGYDLVITRVPRREFGIQRRELRERYGTARGRFTFEAPFVERVLELAAVPDGVVAIEVRAAVFRRDFGRELVDRVLAVAQILEIERHDDRIILVMRPHQPGNSAALLQTFGSRDAAAVLRAIEAAPYSLEEHVSGGIGPTSTPGCDEIWEPPSYRTGIPTALSVRGEDIGEWRVVRQRPLVWPYDGDGRRLDVPPERAVHWLSRFRRTLESRRFFGRTLEQRGIRWWEYLDHHPDRWETTPAIALPRTGTQPRAVLLRTPTIVCGGALAIAPSDDRWGAWILGLINSSVGCFWMKHAFHVYDTSDGRAFEATATGLGRFPIPGAPDERVVEIARKLDRLGRSITPAMSAIPGEPSRLAERLDGLRSANERVLEQLIYWQEELDWAVYAAFGLVDDYSAMPTDVGSRRMFESDDEPRNDVEAVRRQACEEDRRLQVLENVEYKRRWPQTIGDELGDLRRWSADRIVRAFRDGELPRDRPVSVGDVTEILVREPLARSVLRRGALDPAEVMLSESVPFEASRTFSPAGLRKLRRLAEGDVVTFSPDDFAAIGTRVPYSSGSAHRQRVWRLRGRYNVPHERFVHLVELSEAVDRPLFGWAGADDEEREALADRVAAEGGTEQLDLERILAMKAELRREPGTMPELAARLWSRGWSYRAVRLALAVLEQTGTIESRGERWYLARTPTADAPSGESIV